MAKSGKVKVKDNKDKVKKMEIKVKEAKGSKKTAPVTVPVSSKEILAKAVSTSSFSLIPGPNYVSRQSPRKSLAKCVITYEILHTTKYSLLG